MKTINTSDYKNQNDGCSRQLEIIMASGVLVEQKSVRRTCSPFAPVARIKGRHKTEIVNK